MGLGVCRVSGVVREGFYEGFDIYVSLACVILQIV